MQKLFKMILAVSLFYGIATIFLMGVLKFAAQIPQKSQAQILEQNLKQGKTIQPRRRARKPAKKLASHAFTIEINEFSTEKQATQVQKMLEKKGIPTFFTEKNGFFNLQYGFYDSVESANKEAIDLAKRLKSPVKVVRLDNPPPL